MPRRPNPESVRINLRLPSKTYERIKEVAEVMGHTYTATLQTAVTLGLGMLEPNVLGVAKKNTDANVQAMENLSQMLAQLNLLEEIDKAKK